MYYILCNQNLLKLLNYGEFMAEFAYEDIYELLRTEKYLTDLQNISSEQLQKIRQYFETKKELLQKQKESGLFDKSAREKLRSELENARRALKDLYERREKKVISRAIFTARTDFKLKDTTNFLPSEEKFYLCLLDLLKESSTNFFTNFKIANQDKLQHPKKILAEQKTPDGVQIDLKEVKILQPVPELMGTDLKTYGPFKESDTVKIPEEIANLLVTQGKAEDLKK